MKQSILRFISIICVLALIPMGLISFLRIFHIEHYRTVIVIETVTFYLLLPAYVIMLFGAIARRRVLFGLAAFLVACHVVWFAPEFLSSRSISKTKLAAATRLTVYSQNTEFDNHSPEILGRQLKHVNADVVMLEEFSTRDFQVMWSQGDFEQYKYSYLQTQYGPTGLGIFSKFPLSNEQLVQSPGFPQMRAVADVNGQPLVLWNVHMRAPVDGPDSGWLGDFSQLKSHIHSETQPTLVAGDFNATWGHRPFRNLLTDGYHEAAVDLGQGYNRSWPVDTPDGKRFDGYVRFDHVLYNHGLQAVNQHELSGGGSDHRATVTNLALFANFQNSSD